MTEAIIDEATFNKAQEIRINRIYQTVPLDINKYKNIVYCGCCGKPLSLKHMNSYPERRIKESYSYACRKQKNNLCSNRESVRVELLDKIIYLEVEKIINRILKEKDQLLEYALNYQKHHKENHNNLTLLNLII